MTDTPSPATDYLAIRNHLTEPALRKLGRTDPSGIKHAKAIMLVYAISPDYREVCRGLEVSAIQPLDDLVKEPHLYLESVTEVIRRYFPSYYAKGKR